MKLQPDVDLDGKLSYSVRVLSSDFDGASVEQDLDFSLNRHPESIEVSSSELSENLVNGTGCRFFTVDLDDDDMFDYSFAPGFGSLDNDMFTISGIL